MPMNFYVRLPQPPDEGAKGQRMVQELKGKPSDLWICVRRARMGLEQTSH